MATSFRTCGWLTGHFHYRRCRYHCHLYRPHHHDHCNIDCYHHHQEIALTALITCIRRRTQEAILAASNWPDQLEIIFRIIVFTKQLPRLVGDYI